MEKFLKRNKILMSCIIIILYFMLMHIFTYNLQIELVTNICIIIISLIILLTTAFVVNEYKCNKVINCKKIIIAIIAIGIVIRSVYILYTPIQERQHDMEQNIGHLAYIETIYETGNLPQTNKWQFYQQPLHHMIASAWLKVNTSLGVELTRAEEGIQVLTAIYSGMIMLITYGILRELKIKDSYKILVLLIIAAHPTFIILSGSINNDILMIMFTFLAILYLIKWNKKSNYKNTIILALVTALIALTKISGTIIAIPIIYVFINKVIKDYCKADNKKQIIKNYILKFGIFGLIALGLGLSYSIRNIILFEQSIFYVPSPGEATYCGDRTWWERLNLFSKELIVDTYCHPFEDCNIIAYILKCSLFGEFNLDSIVNSQTMSKLLIIINIIIVVISLLSLIKIIFKYKKIGKRVRVNLNIFILTYLCYILMYGYGNISKPYGCTMDFRYIVPTILTGMMFIIINIMSSSKSKNYLLNYKIIYILVTVFSILSIMFELTYMRWLTI